VLERQGGGLPAEALDWLRGDHHTLEIPTVNPRIFQNPVVRRAAERVDLMKRQETLSLRTRTEPFSPRFPICGEHEVPVKNKFCLTPHDISRQRDLHGRDHNPDHPDYIHFVHIPKAGGTTFSKVLRRMMCTRNNATEATLDCCTPGFCDIQKGITCQNIHGCTNHIPRLKRWLVRNLPSVTIFRNPVTRYVSGWHYRCHNPNSDCFDVRKEFEYIRSGRHPQATFQDYLGMEEYSNIMVKMLAKDKFPYGDYGKITQDDCDLAKRNLDKFTFVGMNEMYDTSMVLLAEALGIPLQPVDFDKERTTSRP